MLPQTSVSDPGGKKLRNKTENCPTYKSEKKRKTNNAVNYFKIIFFIVTEAYREIWDR